MYILLQTIVNIRKTGGIAFSCGIEMSALGSLVLLQSTRLTDGQTDGRT